MTGTASITRDTLQGRRVLVAEDEYMIAEEVAGELSDAGAETLGPVSSVSDAVRLIAAEDRIDGALLDVNLGHEAVWPVVEVLLARGVPLVLATGYDASAIPQAYAHLPRCEKPASGRDLTRVLAQVLVPRLPKLG
jgi:CheY-like chemotaxis protein